MNHPGSELGINYSNDTAIGSDIPAAADSNIAKKQERKISYDKFITEGKSGAQLEAELEARGINISADVKFMLKSLEFIVSEAGEIVPVVRLKVGDLFHDSESHPYVEILAQAEKLGLKLLPHETAATLLLQNKIELTPGDRIRVATEKIKNQDDRLSVFYIGCDDHGQYLSGPRMSTGSLWDTNRELMFSAQDLIQEN
jgi:hypothetical protein